MFKSKLRFLIVSAVVFVLCCELPVVWSKTWRLENGQAWKEVSEQEQDKYVVAVAEIKRLVNAGKTEAVRKALEDGCTPDEVRHVAILATTTLGFPAMIRARAWVEDVLSQGG